MPTLAVDTPVEGVTQITLQRPDRLNAMNAELIGELHETLAAIAVDPGCRVVVLTGAGRGFCAGLDLAGFGRAPGARGLGQVEDTFATLLEQAGGWFAAEHIAPADRHLARTVDMRYAGQNYELSIAVPDGPVTLATLDVLAAGFAEAHQRMYGFIAEGEPVQLVTFRIEATGQVRKAEFQPQPVRGPDAVASGHREVWLDNGFVTCPVYDREKLQAGNIFAGPAVVEQMDTTTIVPIGMNARVDAYLNLILEAA